MVTKKKKPQAKSPSARKTIQKKKAKKLAPARKKKTTSTPRKKAPSVKKPSPRGSVSTGGSAAQIEALTLKVFPGDGCMMLAFDLDSRLTENLAGFAIQCTPPLGKPYIIPNRINFQKPLTSASTASKRELTPSTQAPIQKFNWLDVLKTDNPGPYQYEVTAMYFTGKGTTLKEGAKASATIQHAKIPFSNLKIGFTRGYLSSQAYSEQFKNAPFRPEQKSIQFDTKPYEKQYQWLGYHARKLVFDFLNECINDSSITVDVFAYDLDEPDFIRGLVKLGSRLRLFLDNASLHVGPKAMEPQAEALIQKSAGSQNVKTGHFKRFAHNKVIIQKRNGKATKVLTGSANFSIRGLYVQANNVLVFDDPSVAQLYEQAFQEAFSNMSSFASSSIASRWFNIDTKGIPPVSFAFSPHSSCHVSLDKVAAAIRNARSSVIFAIMELGGSGPVMQAIQALGKGKVFTYGVTQSEQGDLKIFPPHSSEGLIVPFSFLSQNVPEPFTKEWSGGAGQVIHHKFIVVDFNDANPQVFTGSSNLAGGGEEQNGDNLISFTDPEIAKLYAVEAIRLVDHYHFRAALKTATSTAPIVLSTQDWWKPYYDPSDLKSNERIALIK